MVELLYGIWRWYWRKWTCYNVNGLFVIEKTNQIKDGDLCSVFINQAHGNLKSYRADFQITNVRIPQLNQGVMTDIIKVKFIGELYIPTIYDST